MNVAPYIILYLVPAIISIVLGLYSWSRRQQRGALQFSVLMAALAIWSFFHALSVGSGSLEATMFWSLLQYIGIMAVGPSWMLFAMAYSGQQGVITRRLLLGLYIFAGLLLLVAWTTPWHQLWWSNVTLDTSRPFSALDVQRGPLFWLHALFAYTCTLVGMFWFARSMLRSATERRQTQLLLLAAVFPFAGNIVYLLGHGRWPVDDPTPLLFVASCLTFFYALLRHQFLDLAPLAHREVVESMPDGVLVLDNRGAVVVINDQACRILHATRERWVGRRFSEALANSPIGPQLRQLLETADQPTTRRISYETSAGLCGVEVRLRALQGTDGQRAGWLLVICDTTEYLRMERALDQRIAESMLLNQITRTANAAVQTDRMLRTIARMVVNTLTWERLGIAMLQPGGMIMRLTIDQPLRPAPTFEGRHLTTSDFEPLYAVLTANQPRVLAINNPTPDQASIRSVLGELGLVMALAVPLSHRSSPLGVLLVGTATARSVSVDELRLFETIAKLLSETLVRTQLYEEAQRANHLKSMFLATVSHELRTPLTSIIGFSDMLRAGIFGPLPSCTDEPLDYIRDNSQALLRLINDILDMSRIEAGHLSVDRYPVDLLALVRRVVDSYSAQISEHKLQLDCALPGWLPLVYANHIRLEQVINNLLSNAIKYTDSGTISVRVQHRNDQVRLSVGDTGVGIEPEHQAEIFHAFHRIENAQTRRSGGTGIGLAISKSLMELMGGALSVESMPGVGSTFHCDLNLAPPALQLAESPLHREGRVA